MLNENSPLYQDVTADLRRVDSAMTQLVQDRERWTQFLDDPNGTLIKLGLHPRTSPEINERANKIFWATLTDTKLLRLINRHYKGFKPKRLKELQAYFLSGLSESVIRHDIDYDIQAVNHLIGDDGALEAILSRSLLSINKAGILESKYSDAAIKEYVKALIKAVKEGKPMREFPKLEVWDDFYGIGMPFGAGIAEVGPAITALAAVEVGSVVTAFIDFGFWGVAVEQSTRPAMEGDPGAIQRIATAGRMLDLGAELLLTANQFHSRLYS